MSSITCSNPRHLCFRDEYNRLIEANTELLQHFMRLRRQCEASSKNEHKLHERILSLQTALDQAHIINAQLIYMLQNHPGAKHQNADTGCDPHQRLGVVSETSEQ